MEGSHVAAARAHQIDGRRVAARRRAQLIADVVASIVDGPGVSRVER